MSTPTLADAAPATIRMPATAWAVTAATALAATGVTAWRLSDDPAVFACCYFAAIGVVLSAIDIAVKRLPDVLTLPSYPILLIALAWAASDVGDRRALYRGVTAAIVLLVVFALLWLTVEAGLGDVKLAGLVGILLGYFGWIFLFRGLLDASLISVIWAAVHRTRSRRTECIPLGPALVVGTLAALLTGHTSSPNFHLFG